MAAPIPSWGVNDYGLAWGLKQVLEDARRRPVLVRPAFPDERMTAQSGYFLVGHPWDGQTVPGEDIRPIPGILAFVYDTDGAEPSARRMREILDSPTAPDVDQAGGSRVPFGAIVIPRRLIPQIRNRLLEQHGKTYQALFPDAAGLAAAVRLQAVPLPRWNLESDLINRVDSPPTTAEAE